MAPIGEPAYFATGSNNRDDEKTMLNELVLISTVTSGLLVTREQSR
jgi:hypothetical protein